MILIQQWRIMLADMDTLLVINNSCGQRCSTPLLIYCFLHKNLNFYVPEVGQNRDVSLDIYAALCNSQA